MAQLTSRQLEILTFIQNHVRERGYPPSHGEVAEHFGFNRNAARDHLMALARKGEIELVPNDARGIRLLRVEERTDQLPLFGRIAAGAPLTAPANAEDWIALDPALFHPRADFLHRVEGDSMIDAGIFSGDLVGIHVQNEARNGQIIAACLLDHMTGFESITLKRYQRRGSVVELHAENPRYEPIVIDLAQRAHEQELPAFRVAGVMGGLFRMGAG
ncbi:transcriptional repressor LexA [Solimonas marina]|uniref:LexA repressor n=1 Tax=Solimonas marina TaxID=2714601 RepID=A0A970B7J7_9GAMM|nr:transcriptional repressor LexA [Solimonas marina]NKF23978.1 transcriptional repressor LexA [Solimonas marina]